jgi:membrane protease YdiL (CAAX protease family)
LRSIGLRHERWLRDLGLAVALTFAFLVMAAITVAATRGLRLPATTKPLDVGAGYIPVGIMQSIRAGLLEEVVVCGYLLHRLRQLGWPDRKALFASVAIRASYHLYGGIPLVAFTILFGLGLGRLYQRTQRLTAIVLTHILYDAILITTALLTR